MPTPNSGTGPLAALEENGYHLSSFTYPIDLTTDPGEQHFVVFYINETSNTQFKTLDKNGNLQAIEDGKDAQGNPKFKQVSATPLGPDGKPANATINSGDNVTNWNKRPIRRVPTAIALYMPPMITTSYQTVWDAVEGGALAGAAKALQDGSLGRMLGEVGIGVASNAASDAKDFLAGAGITANVEDGVSLVARAARNPHLEMLFRTVGFREYQFDFVFTPRSEQEAIVVSNIIKAFKFYSSPEVKEGDNSPRYYIYPAEFDIEFWSNGRINDFVNKISTCACTNVGVNYTGSSKWSAFRPGKLSGVPVETHLTLSFKELEIITKKRILQNY